MIVGIMIETSEEETVGIYQNKRNNPYILPQSLYKKMFYTVRDYERTKAEYQNILYETPVSDGIPGKGNVSDQTARKAMRREILFKQLEAIEQALMCVPPEYRRGVMEYIKCWEPYPTIAHCDTWRRHQRKFLYKTAENLGEI